MLGRDVCAGGYYGKIEGMRMGGVTMQLHYLVKFESRLPDAPVEDNKTATVRRRRVRQPHSGMSHQHGY